MSSTSSVNFSCRSLTSDSGATEASTSGLSGPPVVEEPRFTLFDDATAVFDYTRLTQWGAWEGTLGIDGKMYDMPHLIAAKRALASAGGSGTS